ncbi:MAG: TerB family tellurite resistance protein [Paracoccaceae bacterium]
MSIWTRIIETLSALTSGESLSRLFDNFRKPPEKSVAFTIAVIALSAKMAKADGQVTRSEVSAFREVFVIAPEDEPNAARVYNLARQDVAGYDGYARRIASLFRHDTATLTDIMEGLFHIAMSDGGYHPEEEAFLKQVSDIFGLSDRCFRALRSRFVADAAHDPYAVLGVDPGASAGELRAAYRRAVMESHPDRLRAHGVPEEALAMAEDRIRAINAAWAEIGGDAISPKPAEPA